MIEGGQTTESELLAVSEQLPGEAVSFSQGKEAKSHSSLISPRRTRKERRSKPFLFLCFPFERDATSLQMR